MALALLEMRNRRDTVHHVEAQRRLRHQAAILPLQPVVPPPQRFLQKANGGPRKPLVRIKVRPGPNGHLVRNFEMLGEPQRRIAIQIGPATPEPGWTGNGAVIKTKRAMLPVRI